MHHSALLQGPAQRQRQLPFLNARPGLRRDRRFPSAICDGLQYLPGNRAINSNPTDTNAQSRTHMCVVGAALVPMRVSFRHAIETRIHPPTASAPHEPGQKRTAAAR